MSENHRQNDDKIELASIRQPVFVLRKDYRLTPLNKAAHKLAETDLPPLITRDLARRLRGRRPSKPEPPVMWVFGDNRAVDISILRQGDEPILLFISASYRRSVEVGLVQNAKTQAIGRLAGGIAHDFNNLLTAILGHCDASTEILIDKGVKDTPSKSKRGRVKHPKEGESPAANAVSGLKPAQIQTVFQDLISIRHNSERASRMVRQLLAFAREQDLKPEVIHLEETLTNTWKLIDQFTGEMVQLEKEIIPPVSSIRMDKVQLDQILINLVINARDAMPFGGKITFCVDNVDINTARRNRGEIIQPGPYTRVRVVDTGSGIDEKKMERIFDPFYTTKGIGSGTGLGLAVIDGIMRQSGGYITVENSPHQLEGALFCLLFPALSKQEARGHMAKDAEKVETKHQETRLDTKTRKLLLVVEDEDSVRDILCRALRTPQISVISASEGDEALDLLEKNDFSVDLVITDLIMPGITGDRLINLVREKYGLIPAICISGYAEHDLFDVVRELERVTIVSKPFNIKDLRAQVARMVMKGDIKDKEE